MENAEDHIIMYLVINTSLNMSPGKLAAHTAHGADQLRKQYHILFNSSELIREWENTGYTKIVLSAPTEIEWNKIKELSCDKVVIKDAGRTEIEANSETCAAFIPMRKSERPAILKKLRLL